MVKKSNEGKYFENMSDHDLLITLNTKFDELKTEIKSSNESTNTQVGGHESRIRTLETLVTQVDPIKTHDAMWKKIDENANWIHDFKLTYKFVLGVSGGIGAVVGFILAVVTQVSNLFNR